MLVLTRKHGQRIMIGDDITVVVNRLSGNRVAIGIEAPDDVRIIRGELEQTVKSFEEPAAPADQESTLHPSRRAPNVTSADNVHAG